MMDSKVSSSQMQPAPGEESSQEETKSQLNSPKLPVPVCAWRILLVIAVFIYSSYTIFVHLCEENGHLPFRSSAVVFLIELLKLFLSVGMFAMGTGACYSRNPVSAVTDAIAKEFRQYRESDQKYAYDQLPISRESTAHLQTVPLTWTQLCTLVLPFAVPAFLYAVNNNLGIWIQLEMDPATYQVLGNFKILSTAILFRLIIKRSLSLVQWFSLILLLFAGIIHSYGSLVAKSLTSNTSDVVKAVEQQNGLTPTTNATFLHISVLGILMISVYCTISGLSGVYTEYVMKKRAQMSIHLQNAMLYVFGVILNGLLFVTEVSHDGGKSASFNIFKGFSHWTWLLIITQSISGIFMGFVMKYSTNITRLFIISSAMLVTTFLAMFVFSLHLNFYFAGSFLLVSTSLYLYHR